MAEIYKVTNLINGKIYIGYTARTAKKRFLEHWRDRKSINCIFHRALNKYGKNNFKVETIEKIREEEWVEKEQYWIKFYDSLVPKGYNIQIGGNKPTIHFGEENNKAKFTNDTIRSLFFDLSNYDLDFAQIASKYGISQSQVERINQGSYWKQENMDYPIRKLKKDQYVISCIIDDLKAGKTQTEIEEKYQIKSRTRLYNINNGKVGKKLFPQEKYPIQEGIVNRTPIYLSKPVETILVIEK